MSLWPTVSTYGEPMASDTVGQLRQHHADYNGDYRVVPAPVVAGSTATISAGLMLTATKPAAGETAGIG